MDKFLIVIINNEFSVLGDFKISNQPVQKKPTTAYVLSLLGGILGLGLSLLYFVGITVSGSLTGSTFGLGLWMLMNSILIMFFAGKLNANPLEHSKWGALILGFLILSILGLSQSSRNTRIGL